MQTTIQKITGELSDCLKDFIKKTFSINTEQFACFLADKFQISKNTVISSLNHLIKHINISHELSNQDKENIENEIKSYLQGKAIQCETNNDIRSFNIGKITLEFTSGQMSCKINGQRLLNKKKKNKNEPVS